MNQQHRPGDDDDATDHRLMRLVGRGDEAAFRELVLRHQDRVVGTVAKMLGDADEAQDIGQQVFLRVWRHAPKYRPGAKFTTWLLTITRNLVFNETRRRSRRKEVSADDREADQRLHEFEDDPRRRPDAGVLEDELRRAVDDAIAALPEAQRMAVVLRRYDGLSYEEIGVVMKLSVPAVKSLLFRARTSLRESLAAYLES
jgi:RNA polymerase sigma-70 factor (ECF subfamily)